MAKQESWIEHQEQKLHKEKQIPDERYDYNIEFTKYVWCSVSVWVSENRKVSYVNLLDWDAERGTYNDPVIPGESKSVCVHSLDFNADYLKWWSDLFC